MRDPFDVAAGIEKKGIKFYSKALEIAEDINSVKLLKFLIGEEKKHLSYFERAKKQHKKGEVTVRPAHAKMLFSKVAYRKMKDVDNKLLRIFDTAIEMEEKSIDFYSEWAAKEKDRKLKVMLIGISKYEEEHRELIKAHTDVLYNYLHWEGMEQPGIES